ncbi:Cys-Gln thioester bond-forming surface protein [[Clostridium] innocuum]|uniref:Cys-Gln thioester bond-forming surface protein n=1 Tax=Clostridium innocuum TaxID=1522 RepID=A0AAP2XT22_CLOIN|nr:Cys-Gln thioester bond-forming surface protein [[Clostridium] innocuum]MCR0234117.1 Cys-Gln thioester bond-forming surface protein [[Clostridium] innocuum]MCR0379481.1 Cys-Gln thioester bond-forming surface protein [[Clostridium] innocuum]MCR0450413.1 Cys-Gln thioester bond-forming surface protein [[Clostridium] innocuum]MCR0472657.1 Cys-Gln thioester bond-forming surface protein [[Clostridium] innocuum]
MLYFKNIKKKLFNYIAVLFLIISNISNPQAVKAAGANVTVKNRIPYSYQVTDKDGHMVWGAETEHIYADGEIAFCVQPGILITEGSSYTRSNFSHSELRKIEHIAYVGWQLSSKTDEDYLATQFMIWEALGATIDNTSYSGYTSKKVQIQDKVDSLFKKKPSFNGIEENIKIGESITLTDTNKVFSNYSLTSKSEGITISKSGNKLTITASNNTPENATVKFQAIKAECVGTSILFSSSTSQDVVSFKVGDPVTITINLNVEKYGSLKITKQDEDGAIVPKTSFKVSKNADMSSPIGTYTTGADGSVTVNDLLPQKYYVQETAVPSHLVLDNTIHEVTVEANQTTTYTARNNWVKGKVQLRKIDPDSGKQVAGATYAIYNDKGQELERLVTKATGYVESGYLRFGEYTVREVIAPSGYILNKTSYPVTIATNEQKITVTGEDERQTGRLEITKEDSVTGSAAQGEATLKGAVYELRAKENILDPADGSVKYAKDAVVATLTTDANAKASVSDLYLGKYILQEKTPSTGYTLDTTKYDISLDYAGQSVEIVTKKQTVKERVKAQAFSIVKISDNGSGEADKLAGVEFTVKAQKDIDKYGSWEKAPVAKNAKGQTAAVLVTDKNGYAVSDELPYGVYVVRETKVPDDHYAVADFKVTITEDSRDPQPWRIFNDEKFRAVVKAVKVDQETDKTVALAGTTFKIKNMKTNEYVGYWEWNPTPEYITEWTTDESGTVMTGKELDPGHYALEEITAPNGYVLNIAPVKFKVSSNTAYETLPDGATPVITVTKQDTSVKGRIAVVKQGEVLTSAETDDHGNTKFKYEMRKLKGAVFEVKAAEDISSPDNQGDILYHKGDLVDTITTDAAGEAQTKLLPLGKYQVSEKTAPNGFTHSDDIREVELVYEDQNTAIVFGDAGTYENERQKVEVQAVKKDADDQQLLVGAEITLYANRDVYNYDGDVIVKAGEKIETVVTGEDGRATFTADLPNDLTPEYGVMPIEKIEDEDIDPGFSQTVIEDVRLIGDTNSLFYATETKAPAGYASGQEVRYYFDTKYTNQNNAVLKFTAEYQNETTKVEISKVDITNEEELPGATLQIKSEAGKIIEEWISTDKPQLIEMLPVGDYVLSEKIPASGYTTATDVPFTIKDTGEIQKVVMKDDITKLQIIKTDEEGKQLPGNRLAIIDKDGKTVDEWITDEKPHDITKLVVGQEYTLRELEAAAGYTKAEDIIFIVRDTNDVQTIDMSNRQTEMHFSKVDETGEKELPGAKLQIIDKDGNIIDQWVSTEEQHTITGLSEGQTYVMKEISAPYGYEIAEEITFTAGDGQKVTMKDKMIRSYIKVNKVDYYDHKDILKVAEFTLYSDAACTKKISAAKTDTKNGIALFDDLTYGTYFIKETKAPAGYELSDEVVKVTVDDEWVNGDDKLRTIIYADKPLPGGAISTGDHTNTIILFIITGLAGSMVGFAAYKLRKMKKASD